MYKDEIINEVWKNRQAYVEKHQHNLARMIADLKERQQKSGRIFVDRRGAGKRKYQAVQQTGQCA